MGIGLAGGFPEGHPIPASLGCGQRCPVFGGFKEFDSWESSALPLAHTLPCLSFPAPFPQSPRTQL